MEKGFRRFPILFSATVVVYAYLIIGNEDCTSTQKWEE